MPLPANVIVPAGQMLAPGWAVVPDGEIIVGPFDRVYAADTWPIDRPGWYWRCSGCYTAGVGLASQPAAVRDAERHAAREHPTFTVSSAPGPGGNRVPADADADALRALAAEIDAARRARRHRLLVDRDEEGARTVTIECCGVTDACRAWFECEQCMGLTEDQDDEMEENGGSRHGVQHEKIASHWHVPTDRCLLRTSDAADQAWDVALELADDAQLAEGAHDVSVVIGPELDHITFILLPPAAGQP